MQEDRMRSDLQEGYRQLFSSYPFEVMITVQFGNRPVRKETAYKLLKELVTKIAKSRKTQVSGFAVYNTLKSSHAHMLLLGKTRQIKDVLQSEVDKFWKFGTVNVKEVVDNGASFYVALNITPNCYEKSDLFFFNMRVLKKYRPYPNIPIEISRYLKLTAI